MLSNDQLFHLQFTPRKLLDHHRTGSANATCQLDRRQVLQRHHAVDLKMALIVERAEIAKNGRVDSRDRAPCSHRLRHTGGHDVDLIGARHRQADIGRSRAGLEQNTGLRRGSADRSNVQIVIDRGHSLRILINHGDTMFSAAQQISDRPAYVSRPQHNDIHTTDSWLRSILNLFENMIRQFAA